MIKNREQASTEEHIATKESDYLEATPSGNIVIGFDNYVKGANAAVAQRRKTGLADQNRVFSRSSVSYNPAAAVCPLAPLPRFHLSGFWPVLGGLAWHDRANCVAQPGLANTRLHARANANVEHLWRGP